jgi:diacylglycerol kinase family enzyme
LNDGLLDVCVVPRTDFGTLFRYSPALLLRQRLPESMVKRFRAPHFELTGQGTASFQLDGEGIGHLPAKFSMWPEKLRVVA